MAEMEDRNWDSATSWQAGIAAADDAAVYQVHRHEHPTLTVHTGTKLNHGAVTGIGFELGEIVTGGTNARTGVVAFVGADHVYVIGEIGASAWTTETITGGTSGSTADVSSTGTSEGRIMESHSPHDARSPVTAYKDWEFGNQTEALSKTLYGGARRYRLSTVSGFCVFEIVR